MKHSLSVKSSIPHILIGVSLLFLVATHVYAENHPLGEVDPSQMSREEMRAMPVTENTPSVRNSMRETQKTMLTSQRQERIINLAGNINERLDAAITRLANITARLYTRIDKLKKSGIDTSLAETKLTQAKDIINTSSNELAQIGSIQTIVSSDSPREAFAKIRMQFINIRTSLMEAHALLRETVALLKEAVQKAESERGVSSAVTDIESPTNDAPSAN